ncbi:MAG: class I SAM-dependent methyltransferase [Hydrogenoanaerobacterium sp.]
MNSAPVLDERLSLLAGLVRQNTVAADIGADHGQLITWLVARGVCTRGYSCDINEKPLLHSRATARRFGVEDKISFVLSDGLEKLDENAVDDVIIAGMGGDLIAEILERGHWHSGKHSFILQPMTRPDELRRRLCLGGYSITAEHAAQANGFCYSAILAHYSGKPLPCTPLFAAVGLLPQEGTATANEYIKRRAAKVQKKLLGLKAAKNRTEDTAALEALYAEIMAALQE